MERIAIIDITSKCNLRCTHCYNQERYWEKSENYKELNSKNVAKIVHRLKEMNFTRLHLLGGEPLLSSNLFDFILNGQKEDLDVSIVTNGTLLNSDMMKKLCNSGVWSLSVSLDGTTALVNDRIRGEGVFNKVVDNIKKSVEIKNSLQPDMRLGISFTLTKQNLDTSKNLFDFVNDLNLDFVNISYLSNEGKARETYYDNTITESDKFQFIDEILFSYKSRNNNIYFNIDARKLLGEYIYKIWNKLRC
ncbi:radical SAM protein [Lachnospiraceae bacterium 48-42]